jgi:energy-coupling factor transporter ATP-binding protein EcfA2
VLDFAELREFAELKLKNYSSGMLVRLAFASMVQADADVMLIDEVLAVGDVAFARKCMDVFEERRRAGKTVVLVTHDMGTVQAFCHRAMLIHDGELRYIGDPEETALRYYRLNFGGGATDQEQAEYGGVPDVHARVLDAWLENGSGERTENVEQGQPINLNVVVEAREDLAEPVFGFHCVAADGTYVFGFNQTLTLDEGQPDLLGEGQRVRIGGAIENQLAPGRYSVTCFIARNRHQGDIALQTVPLLDFLVYGPTPAPGLLTVKTDMQAVIEP